MGVEKSNKRQAATGTLRLAQATLLFSALSLIGCGSHFQPIEQNENSFNSSLGDGSANPLADLALNEKLQWKDISESEWSNSSFIPSDSNLGASSTDKTFSFELSLPYGNVYDLAAGAIKVARPFACQTSKINKARPQDYRSGEIPCGTIVDENWKVLTTLDVPNVVQQKGSTTYSLEGFNLPIRMSRTQKTGSYEENSLDQKARVTKSSNSKFANDISVQYIPNGQSAILRICGTIPGMTVSVPDRVLKGNMRKRVLGINVSASGSGNVTFGNYSYDFARACSEAVLTYDFATKKPKAEITNLATPKVSNGQYSGFRIEFREWWLRLIDGLVGLFGKSIETSIERAVDQGVNDFTNNEVENGAWMERMVRDSVRNKLNNSINQTLTSELSSNAVTTGTAEFKARLVRECRKVNLLKGLPARLQQFSQDCEAFVNEIDVVVNPFYRDPEMEAKGCYSHFANIFETKAETEKKWWAKECGFKIQAQVRVPQLQIENLPSFKELLALNSEAMELNDEIKDIMASAQKSRDEVLALADQILRERPELANPEALKSEIKTRLGI